MNIFSPFDTIKKNHINLVKDNQNQKEGSNISSIRLKV